MPFGIWWRHTSITFIKNIKNLRSWWGWWLHSIYSLLKLIEFKVKQGFLTHECNMLLTSHFLWVGILSIELLLEHLYLLFKHASMILILVNPREEELPLLSKLLLKLILLSKLFFLVLHVKCPYLLQVINQKLMCICFFLIRVIFVKVCHVFKVPVILRFPIFKQWICKNFIKFVKVDSRINIFTAKFSWIYFQWKS